MPGKAILDTNTTFPTVNVNVNYVPVEKAGLGRMGGDAEGPGGVCACPECDYETDHETGKSCADMTCPECGAKLVRKAEGDSDKSVWTSSYVSNLPDSSFLFIESGGKKDSSGKTAPRSKRHLPIRDKNSRVDLPHLRNAISRLGQPATGKGWKGFNRKALLAKAQGMLKRQRAVKDALDARDGIPPASDEPEPLTLWKEADGTTRFLALFSNNFRDDDNPPEIISADAHRDFVKATDAGEWDYPELWVWHVKGSRYGKTDLLAYDEATGMTIAVGNIDEGCEHIAQKCAELGDVMSHGMPASEIRRSDADDSIIVRYRSSEISTLPLDAAANKRTLFSLVKEVQEQMAIPDEKVEGLAERGVDVDALNARLESEKQQAEEEGRDSKEIVVEPIVEEVVEGQTVAETEPVEEVVEGQTVAETEPVEEVKEEVVAPPEETVPSTEPVFDAKAFAAEVGQVMQQALAPINERLGHLDDELKALKSQQQEQSAEQKATEETLEALTPAASSFGSIIKSMVIGDESVYVDGRTKEALDGPKEAASPTTSVTGVDFIDKMIAGGEWKDSFPVKQ